MAFIEELLEFSNMKTHIDICYTSHACPALAHFWNTSLTLAVCGFPLASMYDSVKIIDCTLQSMEMQ